MSRAALHASNRGTHTPVTPPGRLDSTLKKHQTFINRLKSQIGSQAAQPQLLKDVDSLLIEKYVDECVAASIEGLLKCKSSSDALVAASVVSALHRRFPTTFTPQLQALALSHTHLEPLAVPSSSSSSSADRDQADREEAARLSRHRAVLRMIATLDSVGLLAPPTGEPSFALIRDMLRANKNDPIPAASVVQLLVKSFGPVFLPSESQDDLQKETSPAASHSDSLTPSDDASIVSADLKLRFKKILDLFVRDVLNNHLVKRSHALAAAEKRNYDAYTRKGDIYEDRERSYDRALKTWEKGWSLLTQLCDSLRLPPPVLPEQATANAPQPQITMQDPSARPDHAVFLSQEDRDFYTSIRDLRTELPASLFSKDIEKTSTPKLDADDLEASGGDKSEHEPLGLAERTEHPDTGTPRLDSADDMSSARADDSAPAASFFGSFLQNVLDAPSVAAVDDLAIQYCFLNIKSAKRRVVRTLLSIPHERLDALPRAARLLATLGRAFPEIAKSFVRDLENEFHASIHRKSLYKGDVPAALVFQMHFFAELIKFNVPALHVVFHLFHVLTEPFNALNVQTLAILLENAGRFLLYNPETQTQMRAFLDTINRKKAATNIDPRALISLENAMYIADPPDPTQRTQKERPPEILFLDYLIYDVLSDSSLLLVQQYLEKFDWTDPFTHRKLFNVFAKVHKIRYTQIPALARLLALIDETHPAFAIDVIDHVFEIHTMGLELNVFHWNAIRIAAAKYIAELCNVGLVSQSCLVDTLNHLLTFAHPGGIPGAVSESGPRLTSAFDAPDDCFRIRLVCAILDSVAPTLKQPLSSFFSLFNVYILSKTVLPIDIESILMHTFATYRQDLPQVSYERALSSYLAESAQAPRSADAHPPAQAVKKSKQVSFESKQVSFEAIDSVAADDFERPSSSSSMATSITASPKRSSRQSSGSDQGASTENDIEDELARELSNLMSSSTPEPRRLSEKRPDVSLPAASSEIKASDNGLSFAMLTRRGVKSDAVDIPMDNAISVKMMKRHAQDKAQKDAINKLTLNYENKM